MANFKYGLLQSDLKRVYVAYIWSLMEYGSPIWYPFTSNTNIQKLERFQNKCLWIALGVPRCTEIPNLLWEAENIPPLEIRFKAHTAFYVEKYRHLPSSDPLHHMAHIKLLHHYLKKESWQHNSDQTLKEIGFYPA